MIFVSELARLYVFSFNCRLTSVANWKQQAGRQACGGSSSHCQKYIFFLFLFLISNPLFIRMIIDGNSDKQVSRLTGQGDGSSSCGRSSSSRNGSSSSGSSIGGSCLSFHHVPISRWSYDQKLNWITDADFNKNYMADKDLKIPRKAVYCVGFRDIFFF